MKKLITKISILATLILFPAVVWGQRPAAFQEGEQFTFVVSYKAKAWPNTEVASVTFKVSGSAVGSRPAYHIWANGKTYPSFKWFFEVNDTYETWLDKSNYRPLKFAARVKEGNYRTTSDYIYDWNNKQVKTTYHNLKRPNPVNKTLKLNDRSFDALALFYNLRCEDMDSFTVGSSRTLELLLDDTIRKINYKLLGRENKTIRGLGTFKTLKFSCQLATSTGEAFKDGTEFYLWVSDDKNKIPLYIESPIRVGSIRGTLRKYSGLKYPLDSKIK